MTAAIAKAPRKEKAPKPEKPVSRAASQSRPAEVTVTDSRALYASTPDVRVQIIKRGVNAAEVRDLVRKMDVSQDKIYRFLRLSPATVNRKVQAKGRLSTDDSERVVGMSQLIGQVETMVAQSGNPEGFDAAKWVAQWLESPLPALNGQRPAEYLDTIEGQRMISNLLAMMQSGAYA
ncbi:MAG TPA: antitoxin Xre/MbcA/ParS toxin-binding domain-containing protein [Noviherbaspirillum sp.]|nr:antitoxin Xre/MbcA/ParS toxin-binding domain-containing protein [Noviherbaspirillum sp.]